MKRKDNKGRILKDGEYQRSDGRYEYKYIDKNGKRRSFYSWKLTPSDRVKDKHKNVESIREARKRIESEQEDTVRWDDARRITVNDIFEDVLLNRGGLKKSTLSTYRSCYESNIKNAIGNMPVVKVKKLTLLKLYSDLIKEKNISKGTLKLANNVVRMIFKAAKNDDLVKVNPAEIDLNDLFRTTKETTKVISLSSSQQKSLIKFLRESEKFTDFYPLIIALLGTGCRISELCCLTWDDIDFDNKVIHVSKNLVYQGKIHDTDKYTLTITTPKTETSKRVIPMIREVREVLMKEYERQMSTGFCETEVDGVSGFVFMNKLNTPYNSQTVIYFFKKIETEYNKWESVRAAIENREPILIARLRPHVLRHTFATRLFEVEDNIKVVQDILGHADFKTTMDIYVNMTDDFRRKSYGDIDSKLCLM